MKDHLKELYSKFLGAKQKICTDTRKLEKDSVFFALKGPNFNANEMVEKALQMGCSFAVIDDERFNHLPNTMLVNDVLTTLQQLANYHRRQFNIPVLAITGSNGKTTTKELINAVLSKKFNTLATEGNLNNHIGVPLTLLKITKEHTFAIVEMGANHQGEIDMLCHIAEPDYGIITNIGKAHLEGFGGIEGVKKGKGELYRYIKNKNAKIFLHADDTVLSELSEGCTAITYGTNKSYEVIGKVDAKAELVKFAWKTKVNASELKDAQFISSHLVGVYNYNNLLGAACVGNYFGVEENAINEALSNYVPTNNRSQMAKTENNSLILDYYNANPSSMKAAIEHFAGMNVGDKMLILGDMLELGEESKMEHQLILDLLKEKNFHEYILVGPQFLSISKEHSFIDSQSASVYLKQHPVKKKTILVKGSRGIKLEEIVKVL